MLSFDINWLAALVAAVAAFVIGSVWYSPVLFSKIWQREARLSDADVQGGNLPLIFATAFVLTLVAIVVLAAFLGPAPELGDAILTGVVVSIGFVATGIGVIYLFEQRSLALFLINAGYNLLTLTVAGLILGLWP